MGHQEQVRQNNGHASDPAVTFQPGHGVAREPKPASEPKQDTGTNENSGVTDMF